MIAPIVGSFFLFWAAVVASVSVGMLIVAFVDMSPRLLGHSFALSVIGCVSLVLGLFLLGVPL